MIKNDKKHSNTKKIATGQCDDYSTGCFLDYSYFKKSCRLIAINLRKQEKLDAEPKAIQQINFTGNLTRGGGARTKEEQKKNF